MLRTNGGFHPCIMLNDPVQEHGMLTILHVNLTSSRKNYDPTCTFRAGDEAFITKDCWVYYAEAEISNVHEIDAEILASGQAVHTISQANYMRIVDGLLNSPQAPPAVKRYYKKVRRLGKAY